MNKTKIKITYIKNHGRCHDLYCDTILGLRYARQVGDVEVVNNTVLGRLKRNDMDIKFDVLKK